MKKYRSRYFSEYNATPALRVKAPGRINIIGEHTDYNGGLVMPAAIDRYIYLELGLNTASDSYRIVSEDLDEKIEFDAKSLIKSDQSWANFFIGIIIQLQQRDIHIPPFNLVFGGDIPLGGGLSSSSAIECGFLFGLNNMFDLGLTKWDMIEISHRSNHDFLGLQGGIMDHFAILFGKKDHAMILNCDTQEYEYVPLNLGDYSIIVIDSKVSHELIHSAYNDRVDECMAALNVLQRKNPNLQYLSQADLTLLHKSEDSIDPIPYKRAHFVLKENARVVKLKDALEKKLLQDVGSILIEAQTGLREEYEVSCKEIDTLINLADQSPHIAGARMMGGGFGGCTFNLVKTDAAIRSISSIITDYYENCGIKAESHRFVIVDGVQHNIDSS